MSQENQSSLRFSLEESLWFRKGQEVAELVTISLDPDITIQENDQYVTIRGSLELTGEYKSFDESTVSEDENLSVQKYVQSVEVRDQGICDFSHRFPVDITIPNNRIQSIYDIDVMVESFDYTLPERSCLKLSAELTISGLYGARQNEPNEETQTFEVLNFNRSETQNDENDGEEAFYAVENSIEEDPDQQLFVAEARKQPEIESPPEISPYPNFIYQAAHGEFSHQDAVYQEDRNEEAQHIQIVSEEESVHKEKHVEIVKGELSTVDESSSLSSSSMDESSPKKDFKSKIMEKLTKKKSMSLTEFFARKEEGGEDHAKLKVCIVQKGDTLDRLAERYDVTLQNLLRVNHLELNQDVHEGQVLYIPIEMAKK